jgi:uncharacterized membrane protein YjgN (DUF898 family)
MSTIPAEIHFTATDASPLPLPSMSTVDNAVPTTPATPWVDAVAQVAHIPIKFHGRWTEYWRIWIVNLALTVLTVGIYSAWAKVRSKRWFYGQVELDGSRFHYHGQPLPILKGRLIMAGLAITWLVCSQLGPIWLVAAAAVFVLFLPWLVVRAAAFRAWNSSWRGLRFSFHGGVGGAFLRYALPMFAAVGGFFLVGMLIVTTRKPWLGYLVLVGMLLLMPLVLAAQKRFVVENHRFGATPFHFGGTGGALFGIYFVCFFLFIPLNMVGRPLDNLVEGAAERVQTLLYNSNLDWVLDYWTFAGPLLLAPLILLASLPALFGLGYLRGRGSVWQWQDTRLGYTVRFENRLNPWELAATYFVNGLAIALTLGLLIPWAVVRTARLRAESLLVLCSQPLDEFVAGQQQMVGATGDEVGDLLGLDVGL